MLPPGLQNRPTHKYGELNITINAVNIKNGNAEYAEMSLLGMKKTIKKQISMSRSSSFDFDIGTNLWHFYAYLHDTRTLHISFLDQNGKVYNCEVHLNLMPSRQVLCRNSNNIDMLFQGNSYLLNQRNRCDIFDNRYAKVGDAQVRLNLNFNQTINRTLVQANMIDFQDILVIDEISPISSTIQLNNIITQMQEIAPMPISIQKEPAKIYNIPQSLQHLEQQLKISQKNQPDQMEISHLEDEKMMEDDIDRMIAQMQNRPYDSSKYMQEVKEQPKKQNINYINFSLMTAKSQSNQKRSERVLSAQKLPPRLPPIMKSTMSKPQYTVSPSKIAFTMSNPAINYSPHTLSLNQTQVSNSQANYREYDKKIGLIKLKVHEFTMSKMERQLTLLLKIYLNQDTEEFYTINGLRQGETISFNSNLKIDQKRQITTIRFILIDSYDMKTVFAKGTFEMSRLFSLNPTKGIFMVNLLSAPPQQSQSKIIRMQQQSLVRVTPNLKNLRIELEYEQPIEIVQIYLSLSEFSNNCRKICYKIPFTKESIQFRVAQLSKNKHINIFPHNRSSSNRSSDKIIIQVWGDNELIGLNQISLKPIANTNQSIINSSLEPIFLYDQDKDVNDLKSGKNRASYKIKLYYGSIAQVQGLLNRQDIKQRRFQQSKTAVEVQSHLGIYIKQNKVRKEVQIQVDEEEMHETWKGSRRDLLPLQQEELPDDDQQQQQVVEHKLNQSENQFLNESLEQKYLVSKQTMPISIIKNESKETSLNGSKAVELSQTIKPKALKSLTKQFQEEIKSALSNFKQQQQYLSLKQACKPHLLYNFIDVKTLVDIMKDEGVKQEKIDFLMNDVLLVSNDMINISILYDMILGLTLQGEVKQKFIDDGQVGRYCLMRLYKCLLEEEEDDFLFDDNTEFDQSRKIFQQIEYKLTMRQFNLIHNFIQRQKQSAGASYLEIKSRYC